MTLTWKILIGDARARLKEIPDQSAQCIVTSPPYWGLRDYGTSTWKGGDPNCEHNARTGDLRFTHPISEKQKSNAGSAGSAGKNCLQCGAERLDQQIGLELTPSDYVTALVDVFREVRRVLADDGVLWLNLGDSYAGNRSYQVPDSKHTNVGNSRGMTVSRRRDRAVIPRSDVLVAGCKRKDLVGIPWMVAFALRADGWYLRADIVWSKPNQMPESVTDRPTKAHEYIFLLSKSERYFYDADAIAEPTSLAMQQQVNQGYDGLGLKDYEGAGVQNPSSVKARIIAGARRKQDAVGKSTYTGFNDRWAAKHRQTAPSAIGVTRNARSVWTIQTQPYPDAHFATFPEALPERCIKAGSRLGDTVMDPFCGSGTTGQVAIHLGRCFIGIELNPAYAELARTRIGGAASLFAVET